MSATLYVSTLTLVQATVFSYVNGQWGGVGGAINYPQMFT